MAYKNNIKPACSVNIIHLLLITMLLLLSLPTQAADPSEGFDHFSTGFPLTGNHQFIDCSSCHLSGQFKGTPLSCGLCHNDSRAPGKHPQHFPSSNNCDDCHTDITWKGARFDHGDVQGACLNCHNNSIAIGKSPSHIASTQACEDCHNTIIFARVGRVDHDAVLGSCNSCHNGSIATGKSPGHLPTTGQCDDCHNTIAWSNVRFDHNTVAGQACDNCHNGVTATGKHAGHVQTTAACDDCHNNTISWQGAAFDHSTATGACFSCHNGSIATGKNTTHFVTTLDCGRCHVTARWIPMDNAQFQHDSPDYPGDHRTSVLCVDCHTTNNQIIAWPFAVYKPECAGCHAGVYVPGSHIGVGDIPLPISDVADCSGSCHLKAGIKSNQHRASGGSW